MTTDVSTERDVCYIDARQCADRYGFSARHWARLVDSGRAPQAVRFGRLTRWSVQTLAAWEASGCPPIRRVK